MRPTRKLLPSLLLLPLLGSWALGQTARDTAVEVSATVQESPPRITLNWLPANQSVLVQKIYRRIKGASQWTDFATPPVGAVSYIDSAVSTGISYEYFLYRSLNTTDNGNATGYINSGIHLPVTDQRGKVILLVDETMAGPLAAELTRFSQDLTGDGWTVVRPSPDISRSASPASVKAIIASLYNADPANTRALILFGRIPVPYSGFIAPDGHPEHRGAWPADVYYGDVNGTWTDSVVNDTSGGSRAENINVIGDGKFDQSIPPTPVELEVGRIDLANMTTVPAGVSETELLRQYLNRNHNFRHRLGAYATIPRRALIDDHFDHFGGEAFSATAWRNFTALFGSGNVSAGDWFTTLPTSAYLWAFGCGPGWFNGASGVGSSADFANQPSLAVFNILFGSYFGDWDNTDNFLRCPLAGRPDSLGLVSFWAGRPHWHFHHMAMGETIGYTARLTQNNTGLGSEGYVVNNSAQGVHIALMGDPTLRLHPVIPVTTFNATTVSGVPVLSWTVSSDSNVQGYTVSRADSPAGPYYRLGGTLVTGTSFTDRAGLPGRTYSYMVRAVKLETSASGTYLNTSQGIITNGTVAAGTLREINVSSNDAPISTGDTVPSVANGTDFGSGEIGVQTISRTFSIANNGTSTLTLTGTPRVNVTGSAASEFVVASQPAAGITAGGVVTFQITFTPVNIGTRAATVTIASNDADEPSFQFAISGVGLPATPRIAINPPAITTNVTAGTSTNVAVSVSNAGPGSLSYSLSNSLSTYRFSDSDSIAGPSYAWIDISNTGFRVESFGNLDDGTSAEFPIGFSFPFYGTNFTTFRISTNGFISFTDTASPAGNTSLPSFGAPRNIVAGFWDDLILDGNSRIFVQQIESRQIIQFDDVALFSSPSQRVTFQIILRPTGEILFQYKAITETDHDYTVGIQNDLRTEGLQVALNSNYVRSEMAVRILPPGVETWLNTSLNSGAVQAGESQPVTVTLNASTLPPGIYAGSLFASSNDPTNPRISLPVQLTVPGSRAETLGNGLPIAAGDTTPNRDDLTDFLSAVINGAPVSKTFVIRNLGASPLTISPVAVTGTGFAVSTQPSSSVAPRASSVLTVTFSPSVQGTVNGTVSFATNDPAVPTYQFAVAGIGATPIEGWRLSNFGQGGNAGIAADNADPDFDGVRNLQEYAFTLDPKIPSRAGLPAVARNPGGFLQISFSRNITRTDLTYQVESSPNLADWTPIASSVAGNPTTASGATAINEIGTGDVRNVTVQDILIIPANLPRFLRVKVTRN